MNTQIKWHYLMIGGVAAISISRIFGPNVITQSIGLLGDICVLMGIIELVRTIIRSRKADAENSPTP